MKAVSNLRFYWDPEVRLWPLFTYIKGVSKSILYISKLRITWDLEDYEEGE